MKRKIAGLLGTMIVLQTLAGCGGENTAADGDKASTSENTQTVQSTGSSVFTGELEQNVTIRVLENDTAIGKGYFDELITS